MDKLLKEMFKRERWEKGREILERRLNEKELVLNPKKVETS